VRREELAVLSEQLQRVVQEHVEGLGQVLLLVSERQRINTNKKRRKDRMIRTM